MVEMGSDRLHHAFWRFWDKTHPKYEPDSPFSETMRNYYRALDAELGETLACVDEDTTVMIVSDHGAKRMDGGICVNEWLRQARLPDAENRTARNYAMDSGFSGLGKNKGVG